MSLFVRGLIATQSRGQNALENMIARWAELDLRRKIGALVVGGAVIATLLLMLRLATHQDMALLFAGLDPGAADTVIQALEAESVPYEIRGDSVFVPTGQRDRLRLRLAGQGLPASGSSGFELLEGLSGFGTTTAMFDAAYWRAKEGELARTILASPGVSSARVHIARADTTPFAREREVSAAVTVTTDQPPLPRGQAEAIRFLVSSAVAGLAPQNVSVIDANAGIILHPGDGPNRMGANPFDERAAQLKANIERLLTARVGAGRALVEVMIDADLDSETVTERVLDPSRRVAIHSDFEEETDRSRGTGGGTVTVASNLPDGDAAADNTEAEAQSTRTRTRTNYELSEVLRERVKPAGQIRRISVAVLVDGISAIDDEGNRIWESRSDDELEAFRALVQSAMGYDAARGDMVTIQSMEFPATEVLGTEGQVASPVGAIGARIMPLLQIVLLGVFATVLGLFVLRPLLTQRSEPPLLREIGNTALSGSPAAEDQVVRALEDSTEALEIENTKPTGIELLRGTIDTRRDDARTVLQGWIEQQEARS